MIPSVHFGLPGYVAALLCLAGAAAVTLPARALRNTGPRSQLIATAALRLLAVLCLVVAAAHPTTLRKDSRVAIAFAVDRSSSMGKAGARAADAALARILRTLPRSAQASVTYFGAYPKLAVTASPARLLTGATPTVAGLDDGATDIAAALRVAYASLPADRPRKVVLISDGVENKGYAHIEAQRIAELGGVVDCVVTAPAQAGEVLMRSVSVPIRVKANEPFNVRLVVDARLAASGTVSLLLDGAPIAKRILSLTQGANVLYVPQTLDAAGPHTYEARVSARPDALTGNNAASAVLSVSGAPRVLIMGETMADAGLLSTTLRKQGMTVDFASPASAPKDIESLNSYDAVVLNNLSALHFPDSYLDMLRSYVQDLGGGLFAVGGPQAFGMGGYRNTPLERALPVSMDVREKVKFPAMSLCIVLDRSGSMGGEGQGATKLELAKEATMSVIDLLPDDAQVGVLTFDTQYSWSLPLGEHKNRDAVAEELSAIETGGGTQMYAPLVEAMNKLSATHSVIKHVIVITDGRSEPGDFAGVTRAMAKQGITVSTVAIGTDADKPLLQGIAQAGGGRSYYTDDIYAIPRIFVTEAFMASRTMLVEGRFVPKLVTREPFLTALQSTPMPALTARLMAVAKPNATVQLETGTGDPVLASWRLGLGRSAAFMSDAMGLWSRDWVAWRDAPALWSGVVRWCMRSAKASPLQVTCAVDSGQLVIGVDAVDDHGEYMDFLDLRAQVVGSTSASTSSVGLPSVKLEQKGPGRYEARVSLPGSGSYMAVVRDARGAIEPQSASASLPYPEELRALPANTGLMQAVAALSGGRLVTPDSFVATAGLAMTGHPKEWWPVFAILALACLVADLAVRCVPEDIWVTATSFRRGGASLFGAARALFRGPGDQPQRYEDMIWQAKLGPTQSAVEKQYLGSDAPTKQAGLYLARLKRARRTEESHTDDTDSGNR